MLEKNDKHFSQSFHCQNKKYWGAAGKLLERSALPPQNGHTC